MERPTTPADGPAAWTLPTWAWLLGIALIFIGQGWLTACLFGEHSWRNLLSDQPITSGSHPQNFYLGLRGMQGVITQGRASVLDNAFQATLPITPIFDGGRVAELFLLLGGGTQHPAPYKIGVAALSMLVPLFMLVACSAIGLCRAATLMAVFLGQLLWWGPHGQAAIQTGSCELFLASLAGLAHVGCLIGFHRAASVRAWFGLWLTASLGWYLQPLLFPIALPILLVFYLSVGVRHEFLTWHVAFWTVELLAVMVNLPWLTDWLDSWWLRTSLPTTAELLQHRTFVTVWNAPLWAGATERAIAIVLMLSAGVGVFLLNRARERPAARLLGIGATGSIVLALLGVSWEPLGDVGTAALVAPALWFACVPAAHAWVCVSGWLWRCRVVGRAVLAIAIVGVVVCFLWLADRPATLLTRFLYVEPLEIGLNSDRQAIVNALREQTTPDARILWEDRTRSRFASRWSALLPMLTDRQYVGGLDPDGFVEHSSISLINLGADSVALWTDQELFDYCRLYNIRWIAAWSPSILVRLDSWTLARKITPIHDERPGWLYEVKRTPSFALKGHAELLHADGQSILLGNVQPKNGEVVISMHYQAGMRASPGRVQVERALWGDDYIGFVRLRLADPITVVTLTWER